jgi:hypothetical protein
VATKPNSIFYIVAAGAGTLAGAAVLLAASAWRRYKQHRAWKGIHSW